MKKMSKPSNKHSSHTVNLADDSTGIQELLTKAYTEAIDQYDLALKGNSRVTEQLEYAQAQLATATTNLNSFKSGLAAATAAAFAA